MAMTQQHMMYTNKHTRLDSWNFEWIAFSKMTGIFTA